MSLSMFIPLAPPPYRHEKSKLHTRNFAVDSCALTEAHVLSRVLKGFGEACLVGTSLYGGSVSSWPASKLHTAFVNPNITRFAFVYSW